MELFGWLGHHGVKGCLVATKLDKLSKNRSKRQLALIKEHLKPPALTIISDRGTFSVGHLLRLDESGYDAIAAAPWDDFRSLFDEHRPKLQWKQAGYLSIEQQRRRTQGSLPKRSRFRNFARAW